MSEFLFDQYGDQKILAERAKKDINGLSLELTVTDDKVTEIGGLPVGAEDGEWIDHTFNALEDDAGGTLTDDDDNPIGGDDSTILWKSYNGTEFLAKRADSDINGNSLELSIEGGRVLEIGGNPVGEEEGEWGERTLNAIEDDDGDTIQDDNGEPIGDINVTTLWESYEGQKFLADRAENDANGNSLELHVADDGKIDKIGGRKLASDQVHANWYTEDYDDPSFIIGKPKVPHYKNYDDSYRALTPPWNCNCHTITADDLRAKKFTLKLSLLSSNSATYTALLGDIYSIRAIRNDGGKNITSGFMDSITLKLGNSSGNPISDAPSIRKIDSSEFAKSDRNDGNSLTQCRFHFSHFGTATTSATEITTQATNLIIEVEMSNDTQFQEGDLFEILVFFVQF